MSIWDTPKKTRKGTRIDGTSATTQSKPEETGRTSASRPQTSAQTSASNKNTRAGDTRTSEQTSEMSAKKIIAKLNEIEARLTILEQSPREHLSLEVLADIRDIALIVKSAWQKKAPTGPTMDKVRRVEAFLKKQTP